jgi:hypothetical protein
VVGQPVSAFLPQIAIEREVEGKHVDMAQDSGEHNYKTNMSSEGEALGDAELNDLFDGEWGLA